MFEWWDVSDIHIVVMKWSKTILLLHFLVWLHCHLGDILGATELQGPTSFYYNDLKTATNNFNETSKLGEGGFGDVYKVWWSLSIESSSDINQRTTCKFTELTFLKRPQLVSLGLRKHLLSYYLANKRSLHVHSQNLKIRTLIGKK